MKINTTISLEKDIKEHIKQQHINLSELVDVLLRDWMLKKEAKLQSVTQIVTAKELEIQEKTKEVADLKAVEAKKEAVLKIVPEVVVEWLYRWQQFHKEKPSMNECNEFRRSHDIKFHIVTTEMIWKAWEVLNG